MTVEQHSPAADAGSGSEDLMTRRPVDRRATLRPLLWRLHFLGGFLAAPVVLSLAVTGILYAWNPQLEAALHAEALTAVTDGPARSLGEQVAARTTATARR